MSIEQLPVGPRPGVRPTMRVEPPIPGRARESDLLTELVRGANPDGAVVFVEGAPGMGVSSLLSVARAAAVGNAGAVISGASVPADHRRGTPLAMFYDALGPSPLFGVLREFESWLRTDSTDVTLTARWHELCATLRAGIAALAEHHGGIVMTFDDLQWADHTSVDLLAALLRNRPPGRVVVVLGCHAGRVPVPVRRVRDTAITIALGPVGDDALRRLEPASTARRRSALLAVSGGSPRHLRSLTALPTSVLETLAIAPVGSTDLADLSCAGDVATVELLTLSRGARLTAGVAALLGDNIEPGAVAIVAGLDEDEVVAELDDLVDCGLLHHHEGRLRFRHLLTRAAAYQLLRPAWRCAAHRRIDHWLIARDAATVVRAPHLAASARFGETDTAGLLTTAAREVLIDAPAAAASWLSAARRVRPAGMSAADEVLMIRAMLLAGRPQDAVRAATTALSHRRSDRLPIVLTLARLHAARGAFGTACGLLQAESTSTTGTDRALVEIELDALAVSRGELRPVVRSGHRPGGDTVTRGSVQRDTAGVVEAARTIVYAARALMITNGPVERQLLATAGLAIDALDDDCLVHLLPRLSLLISAEHRNGRWVDAARHAERAIAVATRAGAREELPVLRVRLAAVMLDLGRCRTAAQLAEDALDDARDIGFGDIAITAAALRAQIAAWVSGPADAVHWLDGAADNAPGDRWARIVTAIAYAEIGMLADASSDHDTHSWHSTEPVPPGPEGVVDTGLGVVLARAALGRGEIDEANALLDRAGSAMANGRSDPDPATCVMAAELRSVCAQLTLANHEPARAVTIARTAVATLAGGGSAISLARGRLVLAGALAAVGDSSAAADESRKAVDLMHSTGASWLARSATREAARFTSVASQRRDCLSVREREIAALVADEFTNKAIAEKLFLSVRTVDSHVARILSKLGVASRVGVANLLRGPH